MRRSLFEAKHCYLSESLARYQVALLSLFPPRDAGQPLALSESLYLGPLRACVSLRLAKPARPACDHFSLSTVPAAPPSASALTPSQRPDPSARPLCPPSTEKSPLRVPSPPLCASSRPINALLTSEQSTPLSSKCSRLSLGPPPPGLHSASEAQIWPIRCRLAAARKLAPNLPTETGSGLPARWPSLAQL